MNTFLFALGLVVVLATGANVLFTLVLPRRPAGIARASLWVNRAARLVFVGLSRQARSYEAKDSILAAVGPVALVAQLIFWAAGFIIGFGLMLQATTHDLADGLLQALGSAGIQRLIDAGCVVEPLRAYYKDEVREIGRELDLPAEILDRHPFPGPGLAIRCLCSEIDAGVEAVAEGYILPVHSVGVQGDSRSYAPVLCIESLDHALATELINRMSGVNRVIARVRTAAPVADMRVRCSVLSPERLARLRHADAIVRRLSHASGFDRRIWQFPVVLIPLGAGAAPDSVVLRPVDSVDGMTAQSVGMPPGLLDSISDELLLVPGICGVFYDLTHKPPATIEWE